MRIAVLGGGRGGLYFAYLWKRRHPDAQIDLFEQSSADATWGVPTVDHFGDNINSNLNCRSRDPLVHQRLIGLDASVQAN